LQKRSISHPHHYRLLFLRRQRKKKHWPVQCCAGARTKQQLKEYNPWQHQQVLHTSVVSVSPTAQVSLVHRLHYQHHQHKNKEQCRLFQLQQQHQHQQQHICHRKTCCQIPFTLYSEYLTDPMMRTRVKVMVEDMWKKSEGQKQVVRE
jgi:hypothetical protein